MNVLTDSKQEEQLQEALELLEQMQEEMEQKELLIAELQKQLNESLDLNEKLNSENKAETGIESPRPMSYKLDKTGNYTGIGYINDTSDKVPPIISECMLVTGTEYKYYAPVKDAIISNVIERKYTVRNPVDHVAYMQIIG